MTSTASCQSGFNWAFNSLGQSPCLIAAILGGVCNAGDYLIYPLPAGLSYSGPWADGVDPCVCSSVFYSVLSACAACQLDEYITWPRHSFNCTLVSIGVFPEEIPVGTAVPDYAYYIYSADHDMFNLTAAATDTGPESVAVPHPTSPSASAGSSGKSKSIAGPVAGGVVGGVVFFILLALCYWFVVRRPRSKSGSLAVIDSKVTEEPVFPPPINYTSPSPLSSIQMPKQYDPSDPNTFPSTPATSITPTHTDNRTYHYSGIPEL